MSNKKYLVISNACFSMTDSNGRTLANLLSGTKKQDLSQFFTYGEPDFSVCENYYRVTDNDALHSFVKFKEFGGRVIKTEEKAPNKASSAPRAKKTPFRMLLRELVWSFGKWQGKNLGEWINGIKADAIILFVGDNAFLIKLAIKISKQKNIPIFLYTTEEYNFKNYNYITKRPSLFYTVFFGKLKKWYKKLDKYVKCGFFNSPLLAEAFRNSYSYPCEVIYNTSSVDFIENLAISKDLTVSYLGNLGLGRCYALAEIADTLSELLPEAKLDVYGKLPSNQEEADCLINCKNINYKGFISYDEVVSIIHSSSLIIHTEKDDKFYSRDLKYAFSTKIADSVCSGTPLFVYARKDLAVTDFLIKNNCAFIASDKDTLKLNLEKALFDINARKEILKNAENVRKNLFLADGKFKNMLADYLG